MSTASGRLEPMTKSQSSVSSIGDDNDETGLDTWNKKEVNKYKVNDSFYCQ